MYFPVDINYIGDGFESIKGYSNGQYELSPGDLMNSNTIQNNIKILNEKIGIFKIHQKSEVNTD